MDFLTSKWFYAALAAVIVAAVVLAGGSVESIDWGSLFPKAQ